MKILMTTETLGGVWTYCMELCSALEPHDVQVALATFGGKLTREQWQQVATMPNVEVHQSDFRLPSMNDDWEDVEQSGEWLLALERQTEPHLIHLNSLIHGHLPWAAPVLTVAHSCMLSRWDALSKQLTDFNQWRQYQTVMRASVLNSDLVVAPTHAMLVNILRHYGPTKNSQVIANGRDFPALVPSLAAKTARAEPIIFAAGRIWDDAKNIGVLAQIADSVAWPIYVAGERRIAKRDLPLMPNLRHLGFVNDRQLADWLAKASIYVAPSHYQPFGLAILEAARAGCALVLSNIRSLRETWADAAEFVDPNDPEQLRAVINSLISNPRRRNQLALRAVERARKYTARRMAEDYLNAYDSLVIGDPRFLPASMSTLSRVQL